MLKRIKNYPKVIVAVPTAKIKDYCFDEFIERATNLTYPNYTLVICDNSEDKNYTLKLRKYATTLRVKPKQKSNFQFMAETHETLRQFAIDEKRCVAMLHLESDIIPPPDVIERLMLHEKPVVAATYMIEEGYRSYPMAIINEDKSQNLRLATRLDKGMGFNIIDGKLHKIHNAGLGCTLITKEVLEKVRFRYEDGVNAHPDTFFAIDLAGLNIPVCIDTSILCEHRNSSWQRF